MRTKHMTDRMRQRGIVDDVINLILDLGEWNERGDRIVLKEKACAKAEAEIRKEITESERDTHAGKGLKK